MLVVYNCSFEPSFLLYFFLSKRLNPHKKKQSLQGSALKPENSPQSFHCLKQMLSPCVAMVLKSVDEALVLLHPLVLNSAGMEPIRLGGMVCQLNYLFFIVLDWSVLNDWYFRKELWLKIGWESSKKWWFLSDSSMFSWCFLRRLAWIYIPKTWQQYPVVISHLFNSSSLLHLYSLGIPRAILP